MSIKFSKKIKSISVIFPGRVLVIVVMAESAYLQCFANCLAGAGRSSTPRVHDQLFCFAFVQKLLFVICICICIYSCIYICVFGSSAWPDLLVFCIWYRNIKPEFVFISLLAFVFVFVFMFVFVFQALSACSGVLLLVQKLQSIMLELCLDKKYRNLNGQCWQDIIETWILREPRVKSQVLSTDKIVQQHASLASAKDHQQCFDLNLWTVSWSIDQKSILIYLSLELKQASLAPYHYLWCIPTYWTEPLTLSFCICVGM